MALNEVKRPNDHLVVFVVEAAIIAHVMRFEMKMLKAQTASFLLIKYNSVPDCFCWERKHLSSNILITFLLFNVKCHAWHTRYWQVYLVSNAFVRLHRHVYCQEVTQSAKARGYLSLQSACHLSKY